MSETIAVRPDERFAEAKLAQYLRGRLPGTEQPLTVRQFGGGAANLTYVLQYGTLEYVLRRPPIGPVAHSAHDMRREYDVLSVLPSAFPYAPQAYLFCDDPNVLGAPFFVMERRNGVVVRKSMPVEFVNVPDAARRMSAALVDALVDFHKVDFVGLGLGNLGKPEGFLQRQIEGWYRRWQVAKPGDSEDMDAVYAWLREHVPATSSVSLVHNDYKLDNVMLAQDDPGHIVAIFDWDMCTLGDPLSDLGTLLTYWSDPNDPPVFQMAAMMPTGALGFFTRSELIDRYAEKSGRSMENIDFYHALGLFRLTVIIAQIYIRFVQGQTQDERFAAFGPMIPIMAQRAREVSGAS